MAYLVRSGDPACFIRLRLRVHSSIGASKTERVPWIFCQSSWRIGQRSSCARPEEAGCIVFGLDLMQRRPGWRLVSIEFDCESLTLDRLHQPVDQAVPKLLAHLLMCLMKQMRLVIEPINDQAKVL
jgi:hypothetical protein